MVLSFYFEMSAKEIKENIVFLPLEIVKNSVGFSFDVGKLYFSSVLLLKFVSLLHQVFKRTALLFYAPILQISKTDVNGP